MSHFYLARNCHSKGLKNTNEDGIQNVLTTNVAPQTEEKTIIYPLVVISKMIFAFAKKHSFTSTIHGTIMNLGAFCSYMHQQMAIAATLILKGSIFNMEGSIPYTFQSLQLLFLKAIVIVSIMSPTSLPFLTWLACFCEE